MRFTKDPLDKGIVPAKLQGGVEALGQWGKFLSGPFAEMTLGNSCSQMFAVSLTHLKPAQKYDFRVISCY